MAKKELTVVPDTSVIVEGLVSIYVKEKKIKPKKIIIPEAVINELEHQANRGRETGYIGLEEINRLRKLKGLKIEFAGERPGEFEIKFAKSGAVDNIIREVARKYNATLMTADKVQALVAESQGLEVEFVEFERDDKLKDPLKKYFDKQTMSVHLKENSFTISKKGKPGEWKFVKSKKKPRKNELQDLAKEIVEVAQWRRDSFIEIERKGSTILQLGKYRIVIVKPPFGSCWEITAVRPVARLKLKDYEYPSKFKKRMEERAEGILVAGRPGEGKSTFTQALGEFYASQEKIVKTVEAPRDLVLPETITQYSASHGSPEEIRDVLLLNRPDYTIYDEIRNNRDFSLFADMRMAGVGMIGVVHASSPVDAIQRFIGRIELGMVPQIIDTVVFIKAGKIDKVYGLEIKVKVPQGMTEADLARPVILVKDYYRDETEYEIYTYGDNVVVMPATDEEEHNPLLKLAAQGIEDYFASYTARAEVEMVSASKAVVRVPESKVAGIIGKGGSNIQAIEKELGVSLDIESLDGSGRGGSNIQWTADIKKKSITIELPVLHANSEVDFFDGKNFLMSATSSKKAQIKISTSSALGKVIKKALERDRLEIRA